MKASDLQSKMEKINMAILDAETALRSDGKVVNMSAVDREVSVICQTVVKLPPAQAREIQPLMAEMIGNLERFAMALRDFKDNARKK